MKVLMTIVRVAVLAAISNAASAAEERAVEGAHVELDVKSIDNSPSGGASSAGLGAGIVATFPLGRYFGASLGGEYMRTRVRTGELFDDGDDTTQGSRPDCRFDSLGGEAALLFRMPRYFRISAGYSSGDLSADCAGDSVFTDGGRDEIDTEGLRYAAEAYLGDFTLGIERLQTTPGEGPKLRSTTLAASWYPLESLKLELSGNDLYEAETYRVMVEHQLEMLGDGFGIRLGFSTSDIEPRTRSFELGFSYYFGRKVPLQVRDRQWR
jgi:hypothetical protein